MSVGNPALPLYYLVGRMSDQADLHVLEFLRARDIIRLRYRKGRVVVPHEITGMDAIDYVHKFQATPASRQKDLDHDEYALSVRFILENRPIVIALSSWYTSVGTKGELAVALRLGLPVRFWGSDDFCTAPSGWREFTGVILGTQLVDDSHDQEVRPRETFVYPESSVFSCRHCHAHQGEHHADDCPIAKGEGISSASET